ncbi:hypothetical protein RDI58_025120 [Solanum bulbocastanum]|uniref:Uncharacterized protein n=1 Tax=Solanum bulbocastanum TaxID=147425 RepID=A0AAN8T3I8_SOLBU
MPDPITPYLRMPNLRTPDLRTLDRWIPYRRDTRPKEPHLRKRRTYDPRMLGLRTPMSHDQRTP